MIHDEDRSLFEYRHLDGAWWNPGLGQASLPPTQQKRVQQRAQETDSYAFFNLLTGPQMLEGVEDLLPAHRERLFPPTETLSMFSAQVLSPNGSCQQAVNDAALKPIFK